MPDGGMNGATRTAMTPWVARLLVANAVVFLVLGTVLTSPVVTALLRFDPSHAATRPWTFLTFAVVHGGLLHLSVASGLLYLFGPPVERQLGGRGFLLYWLYCSVGTAVFALAVSLVYPVPALLGSTGAVLGLAVGTLLSRPEHEIRFPFLPYPVRAPSVLWGLVAAAGATALLFWDPVFHIGNLGGAAAGYLFHRIYRVAVRPTVPAPPPARRIALAPLRLHPDDGEGRHAVAESEPDHPEPRTTPGPHAVTSPVSRPDPRPTAQEEIDRVLDKISATGIESLSRDERRFLDDVSRRKRQDP